MNTAEQIAAMVEERRRFIVVIGDVMVDRWVFGHRAPSQDGCDKFVQTSVLRTAGGAGNAAASLGAWSVPCELSQYWNGKVCTKTRFVEEGRVVFRHDHDVRAGKEYTGARSQALEWAEQADGVLLSDYDKGFLTPELIAQIAGACVRRGVPCVADAKRGPEFYARCITKANEAWYLRHGIASVVTRGPDAPAVSGRALGLRLPPVPCRNHVGAGDCFAAHLVLALAYGVLLEEAAAFAHSAARVYVQHPYCHAPTSDEVAADMSGALTL